jgi:hypothetical protein
MRGDLNPIVVSRLCRKRRTDGFGLNPLIIVILSEEKNPARSFNRYALSG